MKKHEKILLCRHCNNTKEKTLCFCDTCEKEIDYDGWNSRKHTNYFNLTLTNDYEYEPSESEGKDFCSWKCVMKYLKENKDKFCFTYAELPKLRLEHLKDFLEELKK